MYKILKFIVGFYRLDFVLQTEGGILDLCHEIRE